MNAARVISPRKTGRSAAENEWWANHMEQYLRRRGYRFQRIPASLDCFLVEGDDFTLRLIAQRYGQSMIGVPYGDEVLWEPLWS